MKALFAVFFLLSLFSLTGCLYKMPTRDNICTSPHTNNPQFTREKPGSFIPGMNMK